MNSKKTSINKVKVRGLLRLLRRVRCNNFRVVGAGDWGYKPTMPWSKKP